MKAEDAKALRDPFPPSAVGKLPRVTCKDCSDRKVECSRHKREKCRDCGAFVSTAHIHLDYVGHAATTDRLLSVDPEWRWEPDRNDSGRWDVQVYGGDAVLTGTLTVCGVSRPCVGTAPEKSYELLKQLQSDAIRNGAMRFGVALDLWSKEDLHNAEAGEQPDVTSAAKAKALLVEATGDKEAAKGLWGRRGSKPIANSDLEDLLRQARLSGEHIEGPSGVSEFGDADPLDPGRPFTEGEG